MHWLDFYIGYFITAYVSIPFLSVVYFSRLDLLHSGSMTS